MNSFGFFFVNSQIADNLRKLISPKNNALPQNALQRALYKLSASPECFFALRNNFGKCLAAMNIAHWLLGIGDRHLDNLLIDKGNGELVGIDFNMSFGAATRNLQIPELVPFRLTPQFVNVLKPLETSGLLIKCMAHVLRTFRLESEALMAALEVIIYEPTQFNRGSTSTDGTPDSFLNGTLNPEDILQAIKSKLSGINPIIPIEDDLKSSYYSW